MASKSPVNQPGPPEPCPSHLSRAKCCRSARGRDASCGTSALTAAQSVLRSGTASCQGALRHLFVTVTFQENLVGGKTTPLKNDELHQLG
jgi:hypothetical protein